MQATLISCRAALAAGVVFVAGASAHAADLGLAEAERLALARDATAAALEARALALREQAVADEALPDPRIRLGAANVPVDSFDLDQEPMTQLLVGVQQMFPRGASRQTRARQTLEMGAAESARAEDQQRQVRRETRLAWLDAWYWVRARALLRENLAHFRALEETATAWFASGRQREQDVVRAQLEYAMVEDRLTSAQSMEDTARARLAKLTGVAAAHQSLGAELPALAPLPARADIAAALATHPLLRTEDARLAASVQGVELARQAYKPEWMLDLSYGFRDGRNNDGSERADFVSAMVVVDLPLFTGNRQDRRLAASQQQHAAAALNLEERRRELARMLESDHAAWERLAERVRRYADTLEPRAAANAAAALNAYRSGQGDFASLVRAQVTDLDTRLQALRLRIDKAQAHVRLLYLAGEPS